MNRKEKMLLEKTYKDCTKQLKLGGLTEFGEGQFYLSALLLDKKINCVKKLNS